MKIAAILWVLLLPMFSARAQKTVTHQKMFWLRYHASYTFSPRWNATFEVEDRRFAFPDRQQFWLLPKITLLRRLSDGWSTGLGFTYYLNNSPPDPDSATKLTIPELRPDQEFDYKQKLKKITLSHRYKLEERFIRKTKNNRLMTGYDFNFRFSYQLQLQYPLTKKRSEPGALRLEASDEILLNFGSKIVRNTFDQNRYYIGVHYTLSRKLQAEIGYLNWFQEKSSGDQYYDRDVLRATLYQAIDFR